MIFHYTNDTNFCRIQSERKLSLTKSTSSNDEYDTVYLQQLLIENSRIIFSEIFKKKELKETFNPNSIDGFVGLINLLLEKNIEDIKHNHSVSAKFRKCFVICFTSRTDSRFLWETYAGDKGINFGVDLIKFKKFVLENYDDLKNDIVDLRFDKVIYDSDEQINMLKKISRKVFFRTYVNTEELSDNSQIFQGIIDWTNGTTDVIHTSFLNPIQVTIKQWIFNFVREYVNELLLLAPFFKHSYWKEEEEYRMCVYRPQYDNNLSKVHSFEREPSELE